MHITHMCVYVCVCVYNLKHSKRKEKIIYVKNMIMLNIQVIDVET